MKQKKQINQPIITDQEQREVEKNFKIMLNNNLNKISSATYSILDNFDKNGLDTKDMRVLVQKKIDHIKSI
tara:strand:+ start:28 stop:240 length:213 start_codon:yes stop_codon:yes gene_type:complete